MQSLIYADVNLPVLSNTNVPADGLPVATAPVIKLNCCVSVAGAPAISLFGIVMSKLQLVAGVAPVLMCFCILNVARWALPSESKTWTEVLNCVPSGAFASRFIAKLEIRSRYGIVDTRRDVERSQALIRVD